MLKKIFLISILIISITGCTKKINQNDNKERIYLSSNYYNKGEFISVKQEDLNNLGKETYLLFTYNNYCSLPISCEEVFKKFMETYKIDMVSIPINEFKETKFYEIVKYAPSVMIIEKDKVIAYLDANSNEDLEKYQDTQEFAKWLNNYIYFFKK